MNDDTNTTHIAALEHAAERAANRLTQLRRMALYAPVPPPQEVLTRAFEEWQQARAALARAKHQAASLAAAEAANTPVPLEVTPRLLFVRWLYENGLITDDPATVRRVSVAAPTR